MVRDFGIMFFQDFLLLVCVYLFLMPLHVMEKKKIKIFRAGRESLEEAVRLVQSTEEKMKEKRRV